MDNNTIKTMIIGKLKAEKRGLVTHDQMMMYVFALMEVATQLDIMYECSYMFEQYNNLLSSNETEFQEACEYFGI